MPLLKLHTSADVSGKAREELINQLSDVVVQVTGKSEQYTMVVIEPADILMSGRTGPAAFVDMRAIGGLSGGVNKTLSENICAVLNKSLGIPTDRVYITFTEIAAANWGWNSGVFG